MRLIVACGIAIAGLVCGAVAWTHWNAGTPPTWSYFGERAQTRVVFAEIVNRAEEDARPDRHPQVQVEWPPASGTAQMLGGIEPTHVARYMWTPEQIVREHPVGKEIEVRIVDGAPFADRSDVTEMAYSIFFSICTLACVVLVPIVAFGGRTDKEGESRA